MNMIEPLVGEFEHESGITRKLLERVPDEHFDWKPHEKSMTLRELASHLANIPEWATVVASQDSFEFDSATYKPFVAANRAELLEHFDRCVFEAGRNMKGITDEQLMAKWSLIGDGKVYFERPRIEVLRSMILSHAVHHRGQLSVYLRLQNVPVPAIYGPSADERV